MGLKGIKEFNSFDMLRFQQGKEFTVTSCRKWFDYDDKSRQLGTRIEVAITRDDTKYAPSKNGEAISNLYEKLTFKVSKDVTVPVGAVVEPVNAVATVFGDYGNQLSIKADDVKIVGAASTAKA